MKIVDMLEVTVLVLPDIHVMAYMYAGHMNA